MRLAIRRSGHLDDWYVVERAEHDGRSWLEPLGENSAGLRCSSRFSDADVEGTAAEMLALAEAIEARGEARFRRCAVDARSELVTFCSPRNSQLDGEVTLAEALALAAEIRATLGTGTGIGTRAPVEGVAHVEGVCRLCHRLHERGSCPSDARVEEIRAQREHARTVGGDPMPSEVAIDDLLAALDDARRDLAAERVGARVLADDLGACCYCSTLQHSSAEHEEEAERPDPVLRAEIEKRPSCRSARDYRVTVSGLRDGLRACEADLARVRADREEAWKQARAVDGLAARNRSLAEAMVPLVNALNRELSSLARMPEERLRDLARAAEAMAHASAVIDQRVHERDERVRAAEAAEAYAANHARTCPDCRRPRLATTRRVALRDIQHYCLRDYVTAESPKPETFCTSESVLEDCRLMTAVERAVDK